MGEYEVTKPDSCVILSETELTQCIKQYVEGKYGSRVGIIELVSVANFHLSTNSSIEKPCMYAPQIYANVQLFAKPDTEKNTGNEVATQNQFNASDKTCQCKNINSPNNDLPKSHDIPIIPHGIHSLGLETLADIHENRDLGDEQPNDNDIFGWSNY